MPRTSDKTGVSERPRSGLDLSRPGGSNLRTIAAPEGDTSGYSVTAVSGVQPDQPDLRNPDPAALAILPIPVTHNRRRTLMPFRSDASPASRLSWLQRRFGRRWASLFK